MTSLFVYALYKTHVFCIYALYFCYVHVFAEFSIKLTPLKEIPITLKSHHSRNTGGENIDGVICKYIVDSLNTPCVWIED